MAATGATGATVFGTARNLDKARDALAAAVLENGLCHLLYTNYTDLVTARAGTSAFRQ